MDLADSESSVFADESFAGLDLTGATLEKKTFEYCRFERCRLQGARLRDCRFTDCVFEECDLSVVQLEETRLVSTRFVRSKLRGVDWTAAAGLLLLSFDACVLDDGSFAGLDLSGTKFGESSAREACFVETDLRKADLHKVALHGARIHGADLREADLRRATGYAIDPTANRVAGLRATLPEVASLLGALGVRVDIV